jgi:hypothetical protein
MFTCHRGTAILEWIVLGALVIAVIGGAMWYVAQSIAAKLNQVNVAIGS